MKHRNAHKVELQMDMFLISLENCPKVSRCFAYPLTENVNPTLIDRDGPHRHEAVSSGDSS